MTSDGISDEDWDIVKDLSANIVNAVSSNNNRASARLTQELFQHLSRLESKYGTLPSILATQADYTDDTRMRTALLEQAWRVAKKNADKANLVFISSSLAELFIEELCRVADGEKWLSLLEESLEGHWDDHEYKEFQRFRQQLQQLKKKGPRKVTF
jgi:hypothetical protein